MSRIQTSKAGPPWNGYLSEATERENVTALYRKEFIIHARPEIICNFHSPDWVLIVLLRQKARGMDWLIYFGEGRQHNPCVFSPERSPVAKVKLSMISFEFMTPCECRLVFFFFSNLRGVSRNFTQWTSNERKGLCTKTSRRCGGRPVWFIMAIVTVFRQNISCCLLASQK